MSSEVCPYCGKTYKRLKSHLPHCKAASTSKTPAIHHHVTANQPTSPPQLDTSSSKTTAKDKNTMLSAAAAAGLPTQKDEKLFLSTVESGKTLTTTSSSTPPSTKKKKLKLADQIKTPTDPLLSPPPSIPKTKKKSLRALIESAKSSQGPLEGTGRPSEDLPSASPKDNLEFIPADVKSKDAPKKRTSRSKKAGPLQSSDSMDSKEKERSTKPRARDKFWVESEDEMEEELSGNSFQVRSGGSEQVKITLQNVKATLGRAKAPRKSSETSILDKIHATEAFNGQIQVHTSSSPVRVEPVTLTSINQQLTELQPVKKRAPESKQTALVPLRYHGSPQPHLRPLGPSSQVRPVAPPPPPPQVSLVEGLKVRRHVAGLLSTSPLLSQYSSPLGSPPLRAERLQPEPRVLRLTTGETPAEALSQQALAQVRLRELPEWLALNTPSHPREVVQMVQRGWQWYYRRYIDVKKGGVAGLGMLLAGYCVLSYIWSYPHIKLDRWRKYH